MEEYKLIDLGLPSGTLWMDRNVGASSPTDFGLYFAWGETTDNTADEVGETKQFSWSDYKYCNAAYTKLTKYCNNSDYGLDGYTDSCITLQITDDAAYQFTDGKCQIPTREQVEELLVNTTYKWTIQDGVKGGLFTSKINGNSIFVPANGYCDGGSICHVGYSGGLWSSSLYEYNPNNAWCLYFDIVEAFCSYDYRYYGLSVRGTSANKN